MGHIIEAISNYDPDFEEELEARMLEVAPDLPKAERAVLANQMTGVPFTDLSFEECIKIIVKAIEVVPGYEVAVHDVDENDVASEEPNRTFSWDRQAVVRDRFHYLLRYGRKVVPADE